jgi:uncharacterized protein YecE (DUF72 family)
MPDNNHYFLGLPAWAFPGWKDRYFTDSPSRLASYSSVFHAVEGNTTFYRIPDPTAVNRWRTAVAGRRFRFCFKLPRDVTHERHPDLDALAAFLGAIEPLADHLAPLLVQFPVTVGPDELLRFEPVFTRIAASCQFLIEVRHPAFFDDPELLEPTLQRFGAGRVVLDSRPLYRGDCTHPDVREALHVKPDVPVRPVVYNGVALVRLILHPDIDSNRRYIDEWARHVAGYLTAGIDIYMMIHCPNNLHCPPLARAFHDTLRTLPGMGGLTELPLWPLPAEQQALLFP